MPVRPNIARMAGYTPGEQPRAGEVLKLNTNESPYPPSPRVFEAVRTALTGDAFRKYPDPLGTRFRQTAGRVLGVDPDGVLIGNGSDDILTILTRAFVPEGGRIVSPTPSYILYGSLAEIQNAHFETVPFRDDWTPPIPWPAIGADLTFLANPNSPSGTALTGACLEQFIDAVGGPVVLDEAYADFADTNGLHLATRPDLVVTRTLSKSYALAGIRFGFAVARPELVRELNKVKDSYNCDVLALAAAEAALADQDYLRETVAKVRTTRGRLADGLRELGYAVTPSQANFVWARHPTTPHRPVYEGLKARGILIRYMNYAGYGDGLRVSVGTEADIDRLLAEMRRLV